MSLDAVVDTPAWTLRAKCRILAADPLRRDLHFPAERAAADIARAKRFCHGCPVVEQCLIDGMNEPHGVRGGLTPDERHRIRDHGGTRQPCPSCRLPFVPSPANPSKCTGCAGRGPGEIATDQFKDEILAMAARGVSGEKIRDRFGISRDELRDASRRWQVPLVRPGRPPRGLGNRHDLPLESAA